MKRFSRRELTLLSLPAVALLALPLFLQLLPRPNGMRVVAAHSAQPSPASVKAGADVAVQLKLDEIPNDNIGMTWTVSQSLVAGSHLLWDDQTGNRERNVIVDARRRDGGWYEWNGAFDLTPVPTQWGEVALVWDAQLTHPRKRWFRSYIETSRKNGRIVLRKAGEQLPAPKVSRDPHLQLLRVEIGPAKMSKSGTLIYPIYPIKFFFERDAISRVTAPSIYCDYEVRPREGFMCFTNMGGSDEVNFMAQKAGPNHMTERRYPIVEHTIEVEKPSGLPGKSFVDWTIRHGDYWPMSVSIPFSDAKGRVLVGTRKLR